MLWGPWALLGSFSGVTLLLLLVVVVDLLLLGLLLLVGLLLLLLGLLLVERLLGLLLLVVLGFASSSGGFQLGAQHLQLLVHSPGLFCCLLARRLFALFSLVLPWARHRLGLAPFKFSQSG